MAYDVMIASAMADKAKAELVAKRLRALKFKVRYDAKREHDTPTSRDLNDANKSGVVLILWSKAACDTSSSDSDWVHAIAHLARSRGDALVQADLDATTPDEPFDKDERFKLAGMGPKRIPNGFLELVDTLGAKQKRKDLSDFLKIAAGDTAAKDAWKKAHPKDPISATARKTTASKKKAPAKKTAAASPATAKPAAKKPPTPVTPPPAAEEPKAGAVETEDAPTATEAESETLKPKIKLKPPVSPSAMPYRRPSPESLRDEKEGEEIGWVMLGPIIAGIVLMMILAYAFRSTPVAPASSMPAIGNARPVLMNACPAGQVPRSLIGIAPLRTGTIVDDTQEAETEAEAPAAENE